MEKSIFNKKVNSMRNYIMFEIKARQVELTPMLKAKNRAPIALSMGAPVEAVPKFIKEKAKEYLDVDSLHTYSTPKGEARFLEAVKYRMKKRFNVDLNEKKEIFSLIGSKEGISNFIRALTDYTEDVENQDVIWTPAPGYASYSQMIRIAGARAYELELKKEDNYMPDLYKTYDEYVKKGWNPDKIKAVIINYPNNPLGCSCTLEYMQHCVDFCNEKGIVLISDNAYCDMYYDESYKPHSALECKGGMDCCVEFYSLSKSYAMTGWRVGYAVGNEIGITMLSRMKSTVDTGIFKVLQYASADLLESKEGEEYIEKQNVMFKNKIQKFVNGLNELGYKVEMPKTTFYLWVEIPKRYENAKAFADDLLETSGIVVVPGNAFASWADRYLRLSVVAKDEDLAEVIQRMKTDGFYFEK